jgi:hypothetical protein
MSESRPDYRLSAAPRPAVLLGLAGLIPFLGLAGLALAGPEGAREPAADLLAFYGAAILSFMGGCRWGFASAGLGEGPRWWPLGVSVIPALLAFAALALGGEEGLIVLALGLIALFAADVALTRAGGAPSWWPGLRLPLTVGAAVCLLAGAAA